MRKISGSNPKVWFTFNESRFGVDLGNIIDVDDLKKSIKAAKPIQFANYDHDELILKAKKINDAEADQLDDGQKDLFQILHDFKVELSEEIILAVEKEYEGMSEEEAKQIERCIRVLFAKNIELLVDVPDRRETLPSFKDVMNKISSHFNTLKQSSETAAEAEDIPLQGRDFSKDLKKIQKNIENSKKYAGRLASEAKTDFRILVAGGAPGIGKTRYGRELFREVKQKISAVGQLISFQYIFLDFSNGVQLDAADSNLAIEILLGLRIAYAFFFRHRYHVIFSTFRHTVIALGLKGYFYTGNVITGIRDYLSLTVNQPLFLFLHIDEFQTIFNYVGWKADVNLDNNGKPRGIFKGILYEAAKFMIGESSVDFIQPFLSGTAPQNVIRQKEPTMYSFKFVKCSLLNMQSRINIVNHFATTNGFRESAWDLQERMYFLLCDTGGLPRAIQSLLKCCFGDKYERTANFFENIDLLDYNAIYSNMARDIDNMYAITIWAINHSELAEAIIYRCLAAMPSMKSDSLSVKYSDTLESLERDQHLVLTDYAENDNRVLITLPPIFIHLYIQALKSVVCRLRVSFLPGWKMEWHDFEILVAEYVAFRIKALLYFGYKTVALKNIFRGAYGDDTSLETQVELRELAVHQLRNKFPVTYPITNQQGVIVDFKSGVIVNGDKASFADSFLVFEEEKLIVWIQNKLRKGSFKKADMKKEHDKNVASVKSAQRDFGISNYNVITVFISPADFKEDISGYCKKPLPNCLMIYRHNFEDFFGHILSCRAAVQISRERNPNFTPPDRWLSVSTKVPDHIVEQVPKKRPLRSPQDVYNLDPWFQNYPNDIDGMTFSLYTDVIDLANPNKKRRLDYYDEVPQ